MRIRLPGVPPKIPRRTPPVAAAFLFAAALLGASAGQAEAHGLNGSFFTLTVEKRLVSLKISWTLQDVLTHFNVQQDSLPALSPGERERAFAEASGFALKTVSVSTERGKLALRARSGALERDAAGQEFIAVELAAETPLPAESVTLSLEMETFNAFGQTYSCLLRVVAGDQTQQAVLTIGQPAQTFTVGSPRPLREQMLDFLNLGVKHIFLGYDHLMFLAALILVGSRMRPLIKIVTAFTVAHSFTLVIAALGWVNLPGRIVESGIAFSIAYVAVENLLTREPLHRWRLTFAFGLVHGFGFASVLRELGLPARGLVASLLSFNVGVELGQVALVLIFLPFVRWLALRSAYRKVVLAASCVILAFGAGWFIERAFGLRFMPI